MKKKTGIKRKFTFATALLTAYLAFVGEPFGYSVIQNKIQDKRSIYLENLAEEDAKKAEEFALSGEGLPSVLDRLIPRYGGMSITAYRTSDFRTDSDQVILARMMLGETEGCSKTEKIAVGYTAVNRLTKNKQKDKTLTQIILKPSQYSCFNEKTDSSISLKKPMEYNPKEFLECLALSEDILSGKCKDPTGGAEYYYNPKLINEPSWFNDLTDIGKIKVENGKLSIHRFGKLKTSY